MIIVVTSRLLNCNIVIISDTAVNPIIIRQAHPVGVLYLGYQDQVHYQWLEKDVGQVIPLLNLDDFIQNADIGTGGQPDIDFNSMTKGKR